MSRPKAFVNFSRPRRSTRMMEVNEMYPAVKECCVFKKNRAKIFHIPIARPKKKAMMT